MAISRLYWEKENLPEPKPSASGLIEACNLLHTSHDDCIYVGDNVADIVAAKNMVPIL